MVKTVIFDMDGLLVNSEVLYAEAWVKYGQINGLDIGEKLLKKIRGQNSENIMKIAKELLGADLDFEKLSSYCFNYVLQINENEGIAIKKGAVELLSFLKQEKYKIGLATSSTSNMAVTILKNTKLYDFFDVRIYGDMVKYSKPHPDIFLLAAKQLGEQPADCLALEDSANGVTSARAAGCNVIMVPDIDEPLQHITEKTKFVLQDLSQVIDILKDNKLV